MATLIVTWLGLESSIMAAWNTSNELKTLIENYDDLNESQRLGIIKGVSFMLDIKFQKLQKDFNDTIKEAK